MKNKKRESYIDTKFDNDFKFLNDSKNKNVKIIVCGKKFTTFTDIDSNVAMKKSFEEAKEKFEKNYKPYSRYRIFAVAKLNLIEKLKQYVDFSFDIIFIPEMELNPNLNVIELEVFILDDNPKMKECMELFSQMDYVVTF